MNTLTHALVGAAIFGRPKLTAALIGATLAGASLPDVYIIIMVAWEGVFNGIWPNNDILWDEIYYQEPWVTLSGITNSFILFGGLALVSWRLGWRVLFAFSGTVFLHCLGDVFLHYNDGHPHFWPLSSCVLYSPISYWDPNHYGLWWTGFELLAALAIGIYAWQITESRLSKRYIVGLVSLFWAMTILIYGSMFIFGDRDDDLESSGTYKFVLPACPGSIDAATQPVQIEG